MNYIEEMAKMLDHLDANRSPETVTELIRVCSFGLAQAAGMLTTTAAIDELLTVVMLATRREAHFAFAENQANAALDKVMYGQTQGGCNG